MQAGATTRKGTIHVERQNSEISYFADDEDGNRKKYSRRGEDALQMLHFHNTRSLYYGLWSNCHV